SRPTTGLDRSAWDPPRRSTMTPGAEPNDDPSPRTTSPGNRCRTPRTKRVHPVDPSDEAVSRSDTLLAAEPFRDGPESPREALTGPPGPSPSRDHPTSYRPDHRRPRPVETYPDPPRTGRPAAGRSPAGPTDRPTGPDPAGRRSTCKRKRYLI